MKLIRHVVIVCIALLLLVGIPVYQTGYIQGKFSGTDTISSATVIVEQPSGEYVVLINPALHTNADNLAIWVSFFQGKEIDYLFEDISCAVADSDSAGLEIAKSFQSRLPENQMRLHTEDPTLMLSKAKYGKFDVILLSKEVADIYKASYGMDRKRTVILEEGGL